MVRGGELYLLPSLSGQDHQVQGLRRPHIHNISLTMHYISKKDNLKLALYLSFVGRHIHSSELYMGGWRISGSLYVYDTLNIIHKDAQRHQMHDSHWRPQTLAQSLKLTHLNIRTQASEYIQTHSCMHVLFRPRKMEMHSHTWNWIFVLEMPSVSYTDPHALKSPISKCYVSKTSIIGNE